ncbi:MAG: hypothetical protein COV29_03290 [Candidatus Yanofskybacteria bacterium CG10_big_fil_rev_8_21_14_0_10_36_16]|uniref:Uncharacterized protein n=1 Tax=Candidatus Yanofskybacteria bacterium CG10_big_fil_rev_8_21_14_0_10_36_16 TaxID=1975096 RepID=A0A2J0Q7A7_9BACT|nr:MAG: hypothetical protein COV29_03290 [Candidatus Yanofskybacteria bacterium CG10_big_fil_rev_8_21_14_0_10_36_16]
MNLLIILSVFIGIGMAVPVFAHCPLCTAGAGLAALGAKWLGVGAAPIGVFVGAFGMALGYWASHWIKKNYFKGQGQAIVAGSFVGTVVPLVPLMQEYSSVYVPFLGEYGRTYLINHFLIGSLVGGIVIVISPIISKKISLLRNGSALPYQGLITTFLLLLASASIFELLLW